MHAIGHNVARGIYGARGDWLFRGPLVAICLALYLAGTPGQGLFDRDEA